MDKYMKCPEEIISNKEQKIQFIKINYILYICLCVFSSNQTYSITQTYLKCYA